MWKLYLAAALAFVLSLAAIKYLHTQNQSLAASLKTLEATNESLKNQADRLSNRPRTDDDVLKRLCAWADNNHRAENDGKQRVSPLRCP